MGTILLHEGGRRRARNNRDINHVVPHTVFLHSHGRADWPPLQLSGCTLTTAQHSAYAMKITYARYLSFQSWLVLFRAVGKHQSCDSFLIQDQL